MPFADDSLDKVPDGVSDEGAVMLSDILPTGFEIGVRYGRVEPGDVDAVVDLDANRLEQAASFGATDTVTSGDEDWVEQVLALTDGLGVDVAIEAVGVPATFAACLAIVRPGRIGRQRRCARHLRAAAPAGPLDHGPLDHHGAGQHLHHRDAAEARGPVEARGDRRP